VVPAPGRHRMPEVVPPLALESSPYGDHPSSPQPRISDPAWSPPYDGYPSWPHPGVPGPGWQPRPGDPGGRGREPRPVLDHDQDRYVAWSSPAVSAAPTTRGRRWVARAYQDASGRRRIQLVLTGSPVNHREAATGPRAHASGVLQLPECQWTRPAGPAPIEDSVRLANRILSDADNQAAVIRQEALAQADATRAAAEQEAARTRQEASAQADATRAAAEQGAAELRQVAAYIKLHCPAGFRS
jgi:hypothetical protein